MKLRIKSAIWNIRKQKTPNQNAKKKKNPPKMRRQRSMSQMKKLNRNTEKEPNKMETSNLLDAECKTLVIRMLKELSENFNSMKKNIETIKKKRTSQK